MSKTLVILTEVGDSYPQFKIIEGDLSHLNSIYVNSNDADEELQQEILDLFYNGGSTGLIEGFSMTPPQAPFDFQHIIHCGFLL